MLMHRVSVLSTDNVVESDRAVAVERWGSDMLYICKDPVQIQWLTAVVGLNIG